MTLTTSGRTWDEASSPAAVRLARRFEDAWRDAGAHGRRPEPGDFLADDAGCPGARLALLRAEMGLRWEAGEKVGATWFRERYPDLGGETLVALIYEEFCLREEDDPDRPPDPAAYFDLYPEVAPALRRVLDIHGLVGS
ncbi:MAG: serine/threonine protein kinase, partial [Planctomycetia bacterium]|nr:serine/threonine protein kinase [Planctomycetia bacterium]